jgi:hypothetical protein
MLTVRIEIKNFNKNLTLNNKIKKKSKEKKNSLAHNVDFIV